MSSHVLNVSTERLETLFWTSRLGLETLTSRSRLSLGILRLVYNPGSASKNIKIKGSQI